MAKTPEEKAAILAEKEAAKAAKIAAEEAAASAEAEAKAQAKAAKEAAKTSAVVVNAQGLHVRTFNLADHGEGFAELALGYAKKVKGKVL